MSKCRYDVSEDCNSNKDCLSCILDKIRAEIEQIIREEIVVDRAGGEYERLVSTIDPDDVLDIINKYRGESED